MLKLVAILIEENLIFRIMSDKDTNSEIDDIIKEIEHTQSLHSDIRILGFNQKILCDLKGVLPKTNLKPSEKDK